MPDARPQDARDGSALSDEDVAAAARLARLAIDPARRGALRHDLAAILDYVRTLRELDLEGVEPLATPLDLRGTLAPDEPGAALPLERVMALAPETMPPFLRVPRVLDDGGGA